MNRIEEQYRALLGTLLENSTEKSDRTGTGTLSVFGRQIRHNMEDGFPLLTTKRMAVKTMMTELKWFLKGDTNIKYLVDNNCNVWNGDAYKKYAEQFVPNWHGPRYTQERFIDLIKTNDAFARDWGELGPIYGKQWRDWDGRQELDGSYDMSLDQIANLIFQLKRNPDSRRLMVNAWNVGELSEMTLPPCHYGFQVYTRKTTREEKIVNPGKYRAISLMWNQRSVDTFLGLPFNIASYAALLCLIAEEVNMIPDQLIGNLGDVHLYKNHVDQAQEQISREIYDLPTVEFSNVDLLGGEFDFEIKDYKYHPSIKAPLSN
jgi:thymidylate synthase